MREIKFRGKSKRTGKWLYGSLVDPFDKNEAVIFRQGETDALRRGNAIYPGLISVDPETVGQYTGLRDKTVREIYEGDIVRVTLSEIDAEAIGVVEWNNETCVFGLNLGGGVGSSSIAGTWRTIEVIGNIHDNPELLEERR